MSAVHPDGSATCSACGDTFPEIAEFKRHRDEYCRELSEGIDAIMERCDEVNSKLEQIRDGLDRILR